MFGSLDAHRDDVDAGDLEGGAGARALVRGVGIRAGEVLGEDDGLFPDGCDEPVHLAAVLGAFADGVDARFFLAAHLVVDDDAAFDDEAAGAGEFGVGTDAGGDHDHVGVDDGAVGEVHGGHGAAVVAQDGGGAGAGVHGDAESFDFGAQYPAAAFVELLVHQVGGRVHHGDGQALGAQPVGGFEAEQAAADDDGADVVVGVGHLQHAVGVGEGAEAEDPAAEPSVRFTQPVHVGEEGVRSGRDDEQVVGDLPAGLARDGLAEAVETGGAVTGVQGHAVRAVPAHRIEDEVVVDVGLPGQQGGNNNPLVVAYGSSPIMVMSNWSRPPRARISSTVRAPAMPLPTTSRRRRGPWWCDAVGVMRPGLPGAVTARRHRGYAAVRKCSPPPG